MTEQDFKRLEQGTYVLVPRWDYYLRYLSLIALISTIFYIGAWTADAEARMFDSPEDKALTKNHLTNGLMHPNGKDVEDKFVTRREYEQTLITIASSLSDLKEGQKELNKKINK